MDFQNLDSITDLLASSLDMLPNDERNTLLHTFNQTETNYPREKTLSELFEAQVARTPDKIALVFEDQQLTYAELNTRANQLAHHLLATYQNQQGCVLPADTLIALYLDRSLEMVISILAVLKAGAAYVPISPDYPEERTRFILEDTQALMLLTHTPLVTAISPLIEVASLSVTVICADDPVHQQQPWVDVLRARCSQDLAYVIYTSGTTGQPKGVMVEHQALLAFCCQPNYFDLNRTQRIASLSPYVFDGFIFDLMPALIHGFCVSLYQKAEILNLNAFCERLREDRIDTFFLTTALFNELVVHGDIRNTQIQQILFGGERCDPTKIEAFKSRYPEVSLRHVYGPTEAVVFASVCELNDRTDTSIGASLNNQRLYVMQSGKYLAPLGAVGELVIGGASLARGYLNQPELTADRFIDNPFATDDEIARGETRLYRTGDLVCWLPDGHLEYLGRNDQQVKIRGHRIELGEIASVLSDLDGVSQAVVIDIEREQGKALVGYVVASATEIDVELLRRALSSQLPDYMVPSVLMCIDEVPLTINGKLDRQALPEPEWQSEGNYVAPSTELEQSLCDVWQSILGLERVGIDDEFFRLGGDSILSIQVVNRLREQGHCLNVKAIYDHPTIASLAEYLQQAKSETNILTEQGPLTGEFGLLPIQHWFINQALTAEHHWNQAFTVRIPADTTTKAIQMALSALAAQHDMLRATFMRTDNGCVQVYQAIEEFKLPELFVSDITLHHEAEVHALLTDWQSHFDLASGPLWQAGFLTGFEDGEARLFFAAHHLVIDAVSWRILADDLRLLLTDQSLLDKGSSYRQWVDAVKTYGDNNPDEAEYWQSKMATSTEHAFHPLTRYRVQLSESETQSLLAEANEGFNTRIDDLLLSAVALALSETFNDQIPPILLEGHGREGLDDTLNVSRTVGWFTVMYPHRLAVGEDMAETIVINKEALRSIPNKGIGFGALSENLTGHLPQVSFNYLGQFGGSDDNATWTINFDAIGDTVSAANSSQLLLNINGAIYQNTLQFEVQSQLDTDQSERFTTALQNALNDILETAVKQAKMGSRKTPSDYGSNILGLSQLAQLESTYPDIDAIYPANSLQQGFISHHLNRPDDDAYRVQLLVDYHYSLDIEAYQQAWHLASLTYPSLRMAFNWQDKLLQVISRGAGITKESFTLLDLSDVDEEKRERRISELQQADRKVGFDLTCPGLVRFTVIKHNDNHFTVMKTEHHSISDGWSAPILWNQVHAYYEQLVSGHEPEVKTDSAYGLAQQYSHSKREEFSTFWHKEKDSWEGINDLSSMMSHPVALGQIKEIERPASSCKMLDDAVTKNLKTQCLTIGVTLNAAVQFAWHKLIQIYTGSDQTLVGTTVSGRDLPVQDIESSVGPFINTLPLSVNWLPGQSISEVLRSIQTQIANLNSHSGVDLSSMQRNGERLFHSLLVFENYPMPREDGDWPFSFREYVEKLDYPLALIVYERDDNLVMTLKYGLDWLSEEDAQRLLDQLRCVLVAICEDPQRQHETVSVLSEDERKALLDTANGGEISYPKDATLVSLFEEQVAKTPNQTALVYEGESLTYAELNTKANQLAYQLLETYHAQYGSELPADTLIALYLDRSLEMVISILAVLKAGAAYVPISPDYPSERTRFIMEDTQASIVLTHAPQSATIAPLVETKSLAVTVICADDPTHTQQPVGDVPRVRSSGDLAYVIYTSGTTGQPKGVMIEHKNTVQLLFAEHYKHNFSKTACWTNYVFDVSVYEIFSSLLSGSSLYLCSDECQRNDEMYFDFLAHNKVEFAYIPPFYLSAFADYVDGHHSCVKKILTGVDKVFYSDAIRISQAGVDILNGYGPSETTTCSTALLFGTNSPKKRILPIGKPLSNERCFVLDTALQLIPLGAVGELYIGGAGLARGYLNNPELTAERFIDHPFANENEMAKGETRLYRTGDLVRWLPDGNLEYLGRNDQQVKIRGHRIELGEIASVLSDLDGVSQAVVIDIEREQGKALVAYVVLESEQVDITELRAALRRQLPDYMIPSLLVPIGHVPLTINGKLDRNALPAPEWTDTEKYHAPETELQSKLCRIWQDVLGIDRVGIDDDFFAIGGDSILSIQVVNVIQREGYAIQNRAMFDHPNVVALAKHITDVNQIEMKSEQGLLTGDANLLPIQTLFFELNKSHPDSFPQSFFINLPHSDIDRLQTALVALVNHHDALRFQYRFENGEVVQSYSDQAIHDVDLVIIRPEDDLGICRDITNTISLSQGPLYRFAFVYPREHRAQPELFVSCHHLVIDAVSWRIIAQDLKTLLEGQPLGEKGTSYRQWQESLVNYARDNENQRSLWEATLSQSCLSALNSVRGDIPVIKNQSISRDLLSEIKESVCSTLSIKLPDLLMIVWAEAIARASGSDDDVQLNLEGHGRYDIAPDCQIERTVGWFTNLYPFTVTRSVDLITTLRVNKNALMQIPDKGIGFGALMASKVPKRWMPEFSFNFLGSMSRKKDEVWSVKPATWDVESTEGYSPWYLASLDCWEENEKLILNFSSMLKPEKAQALQETFESILGEITLEIEQLKTVRADLALKSHFTPSDFPNAKISFTELDKLQKEDAIDNVYLATGVQREILYFNRVDPDFQIDQIITKISGEIDISTYLQSWQVCVDKYDVLRAGFTDRDMPGELNQVVFAKVDLPVTVDDWREKRLNTSDLQATLLNIVLKDRTTPFSESKPPMFRLRLIQTEENSWYQVFTFNHVLFDGWSLNILLGDVVETYFTLIKGCAPSPVKSSFEPFTCYLQRTFDKSSSSEFWSSYLKGAPMNQRLAKEEVPDISLQKETRMQGVYDLFTREETTQIRRFTETQKFTVNQLMQLAWITTLAEKMGVDDAVIGTTMTDRPGEIENVESLFGLFVASPVLRATQIWEKSAAELLHEIQTTQPDRQQFAFQELNHYDENWVPTSPFGSLFVFENMPEAEVGGTLPFTFEPVMTVSGSNHQTVFCILPLVDGYKLNLFYDARELREDTLQVLLSRFKVITMAVVSSVETKIVDILTRT
ncbi:non-ribosomal peptide synthetase [Grimontia marina]|uniref:Linear gramicidin synthase subunit D n=1 Tax=Grimontia marina TaxID=646534 RepID=A0A128FCT6_9GAMM|nr:non-ribosomal peptide synthetase [Grimontia marina]CZF84613.1 Linear gramicidin synthase subunit D [Grimontia marina]